MSITKHYLDKAHVVRMEVPCLPTLDDKSFLAYLHYFYNFAKAQGTSFSGLSVRSLGRVEIAQVNIPVQVFGPSCHSEPQLIGIQILEGNVIGDCISVMDLGRAERNRNVHLLYHHDHLEGDTRVRDLVERGVITDSGAEKLY